MANTRARRRSVVYAMSASALLMGTLAACDSVSSQRATFEKQGYSNLHSLEKQGRPNSYRATVGSCTVELFITYDKEIWTAMIVETPKGSMSTISHTPDESIFTPAGTANDLLNNPLFRHHCP